MKSQYQMLTCSRKSLATLLRELDWTEGRIFPGLVFGLVECPPGLRHSPKAHFASAKETTVQIVRTGSPSV